MNGALAAALLIVVRGSGPFVFGLVFSEISHTFPFVIAGVLYLTAAGVMTAGIPPKEKELR